MHPPPGALARRSIFLFEAWRWMKEGGRLLTTMHSPRLRQPRRCTRGLVRAALHWRDLPTSCPLKPQRLNVLLPHTTTLQEGPRDGCLHVSAPLRALLNAHHNVSTSCLCATSRLSRRNVRKRRRHGSSNNALHEASWCVWRARRRVVVRVGEEDRAQTPSAWQLWRGPSCRVVVHVKVPGRHVALD